MRITIVDSLLLAVVVCGALAVRIAVTVAWDLNPDEGMYWLISSTERYDHFLQLISTQAHPPLYYYLLRALAAFGRPEFLRGSTIALSTLSIVVAFYLGARISRGIGLALAVLIAFAPVTVGLGSVIRPYALIVLLLLFLILKASSVIEEIKAEKHGGHTPLFLFLTSVALVGTHYGAVPYVLITLGYLLLLSAVIKRSMFNKVTIKIALILFGNILLAGALYVGHLRSFQSGGLWGSYSTSVLQPNSLNLNSDFATFIPFTLRYVFGGLWIAAGGFVLVGLALIAQPLRRQQLTLPLLYILVAIALSILGYYPLGPNRHSVYAFVATMLFASVGIGTVLDSIARGFAVKPKMQGGVLRALVICAISVPLMGYYLSAGPGGRGIRIGAPIDSEQFIDRSEINELLGILASTCIRSSPNSQCTTLLDLSSFNVLAPHLGFYLERDAAETFIRDSGSIRYVIWPGWNFGGGDHSPERANAAIEKMNAVSGGNATLIASIDYTPFDCQKLGTGRTSVIFDTQRVKACRLVL